MSGKRDVSPGEVSLVGRDVAEPGDRENVAQDINIDPMIRGQFGERRARSSRREEQLGLF